MSVATEIQELTQNTAELDGIRTDIRTALAGKGVTATDHDYSDFAADIAAIPSGGGGTEGAGELIDPETMSQKIIYEVN